MMKFKVPDNWWKPSKNSVIWAVVVLCPLLYVNNPLLISFWRRAFFFWSEIPSKSKTAPHKKRVFEQIKRQLISEASVGEKDNVLLLSMGGKKGCGFQIQINVALIYRNQDEQLYLHKFLGRSRPETAESKKSFRLWLPRLRCQTESQYLHNVPDEKCLCPDRPRRKVPISKLSRNQDRLCPDFCAFNRVSRPCKIERTKPIVSSLRSGHIDFWSGTFTWVNNNILNAIILNQFHLIIWFNLSHSELSFGIAIVFHLTWLLIYGNRNPQCI